MRRHPTWTVICSFNGIEYGRGTCLRREAAQEEAALDAFCRLRDELPLTYI
ncbi:hypothetical protein BDQ17DRAFT_1109109 [Cyathus striatus]|nr:hypothetical protein BDQ17DRAFT_1109109 [Cyathus striatus]